MGERPVTRELHQYRIGIAALQEVRWPGNGECQLESGHTLFYSGSDFDRHVNGTGFLVDKHFLPNVIQFKPISDRISILRLKTKFFNITLLNAYAPTEQAHDDIKDEFYEHLDQVYDNIPGYDAKILLGDLNAKIGREEAFMPTIGKHSKHDKSNDNGTRLISFAASKSMVVQSTKFPHKDIYKGTWKSPDGKTVNQIDHVIIDNRHKKIIEDIRTFRGADCDSDHYLVGIKVKAKIKVAKARTVVREDRINVEEIRNEYVNKDFQLD
ncbi:unnamed protein product [Colias eurytheme]|nr:unnamed protein product [Colias eurytheme]